MFDRTQIEGVHLTVRDIVLQGERLWSLPLAERRKITGLPANRADVILPGVAIYSVLMEEFGFSELCVSTRGLRFGAPEARHTVAQRASAGIPLGRT